MKRPVSAPHVDSGVVVATGVWVALGNLGAGTTELVDEPVCVEIDVEDGSALLESDFVGSADVIELRGIDASTLDGCPAEEGLKVLNSACVVVLFGFGFRVGLVTLDSSEAKYQRSARYSYHDHSLILFLLENKLVDGADAALVLEVHGIELETCDEEKGRGLIDSGCATILLRGKGFGSQVYSGEVVAEPVSHVSVKLCYTR